MKKPRSVIKATVIGNQIFTNDSGQTVDGFTVVIRNDEEFNGEYQFTNSVTDDEALHNIFNRGASPDELNE